MQIVRVKYIVLIVSTILCYPLLAAELPPSPISPTTKVNGYISTKGKYGFRGPENWFMYLKSNGNFPMLNPPNGITAILSPYPLDGSAQLSIFPPVMMSFHYINSDNKSSTQIMNEIYSQAPKDAIVEAPHLEKLGEQEWVVATSKFNLKGLTLFETSYITVHQDIIVEIRSTIPEEYYETVRKLVDKSVKTTKFGDIQALMTSD